MTEDSIIAFIEMQFALLINPTKKIPILQHIKVFQNQKKQLHIGKTSCLSISDYLQTEFAKDKKRSKFEKQWLQLSLQLFHELEKDIVHKENKMPKNIEL